MPPPSLPPAVISRAEMDAGYDAATHGNQPVYFAAVSAAAVAGDVQAERVRVDLLARGWYGGVDGQGGRGGAYVNDQTSDTVNNAVGQAWLAAHPAPVTAHVKAALLTPGPGGVPVWGFALGGVALLVVAGASVFVLRKRQPTRKAA